MIAKVAATKCQAAATRRPLAGRRAVTCQPQSKMVSWWASIPKERMATSLVSMLLRLAEEGSYCCSIDQEGYGIDEEMMSLYHECSLFLSMGARLGYCDEAFDEVSMYDEGSSTGGPSRT